MTLTRWRSTILSATRSRPPRLGGSSRNAASSSSFLSFTRSRFLSSEVTTTFGRARIHREAFGFFCGLFAPFLGGDASPPRLLSFLRLSFPECRGEKVKNLLEKGEGEDATSSLGSFFFLLGVCPLISKLCVFFISKNLFSFHFFWERLRTTTTKKIFFFFFFVVPGRRRRRRRGPLVTALFSETTLTTRRRDERMREMMMMMIKGKNPTLLFISHAHAYNVCTHPIHVVRREGCRLQGGRRQKNQRRHSRRPVRR